MESYIPLVFIVTALASSIAPPSKSLGGFARWRWRLVLIWTALGALAAYLGSPFIGTAAAMVATYCVIASVLMLVADAMAEQPNAIQNLVALMLCPMLILACALGSWVVIGPWCALLSATTGIGLLSAVAAKKSHRTARSA